jgi:hypothetical protein
VQNHSANFVAKPEVREDANRYKIPASILSDNGDDLNTAGDTARASEVQLDEVEPIQAKISASLPDIPGPVLPVSDTAGCVAASVAMAGDEVAGIGARLADGGGGLGAGEVDGSSLPGKPFSVLPSEHSNLLKTLPDRVLPSEQLQTEKEQADWLKSLLPKLTAGWWDVAANGKGFIIKQKWREHKKQLTQPYKRVGREQFDGLKEQEVTYAKQILFDKLWEHLDGCREHKTKATRDRARSAAERLSASR